MPSALQFKRLRPEAILPVYGSPEAIGLDLHACGNHVLLPAERRRFPTGFAVALPRGYYGRIAPRSGLADRHGLHVLGGVIDRDYRLEVDVLLINLGAKRVVISAGSRIAQFIIERASRFTPEWVEALPETSRSRGGFGSTGV